MAVATAIAWDIRQVQRSALSLIPKNPSAQPPSSTNIQYYDRSGNTLLAEFDAVQSDAENWLPLQQWPAELISASRWLFETSDIGDQNSANFALFWNILRGRYWTTLQPAPGISGYLARTLTLPSSAQATASERLHEWIIADQLRRQFSADFLLEWLLNRAHIGQGITGIGTAAVIHFERPIDELRSGQWLRLAWLAADRAKANQGRLYDSYLSAMYEQGWLSATDLEVALADGPLLPRAASPTIHLGDPFFIQLASEQVNSILSHLGYADISATTLNLRIRTSIASDNQREAERSQEEILSQATNDEFDDARLVILDPNDGSILSMVGNTTLADTPPAPILLPFLYLESLRGQGNSPKHAASPVLDLPQHFPHPQVPALSIETRNADGQFRGPILLADALKGLRAAPIYEIFPDEASIARALRVASRFGWASLADEAPMPTLLTESGTASVLDAAYAYATIAANGLMNGLPNLAIAQSDRPNEPLAVLEIANASGEILWQFAQGNAGNQTAIAAPTLIALLNTLLHDDDGNVSLTGTSGLSPKRASGVWSLRYSPNRVIALHLRREDGSPFALSSDMIATIQTITEVLFADSEPVSWAGSEALIHREVCALTGGLANDVCETQELPFLPGTEPTDVDERWKNIAINIANGLRASEATPHELRSERTYIQPPEIVETWWLARGYDLPPKETETLADTDIRLRLQPPWQQPSSGKIPIVAWFRSEGLLDWQLEYGAGTAPLQWQLIPKQLARPQSSPATLATWDSEPRQGLFTIRIRAEYDDGQVATDTLLLNLDNEAPRFELSQHADTSELHIDIRTENQADIARLDYELDGQPLGLQTTPPFGFSLSKQYAEAQILRAIATDFAGNRSEQSISLAFP